MRRATAVLSLAVVTLGCQAKAPENAPAAPAAAATAGETMTGTVLEQLSAPPYRYLRLKTASGETWVAVPEATVAEGAAVTVYSPMRMTGFESKSLGRTFDEVWFGTLTPPGSAATGQQVGAAHSAAPPAAVPAGSVEKATGPDGRTVAEVWAQQGDLDGKRVSIRGVVVKSTPQVMGKNWLHLQDGSGDPGAGTNDITVTTADAATNGQTITVTGTVHTNRDFGAGYSYPVIVEDATVVQQ